MFHAVDISALKSYDMDKIIGEFLTGEELLLKLLVTIQR